MHRNTEYLSIEINYLLHYITKKNRYVTKSSKKIINGNLKLSL